SLHSHAAHRHLHSFPTRRSSDLLSIHMDINFLFAVEYIFHGTKWQVHQFLISRQIGLGIIKEGIELSYLISIFFIGLHATWFTLDRKSTRLNSSHVKISYAVFCL